MSVNKEENKIVVEDCRLYKVRESRLEFMDTTWAIPEVEYQKLPEKTKEVLDTIEVTKDSDPEEYKYSDFDDETACIVRDALYNNAGILNSERLEVSDEDAEWVIEGGYSRYAK